jgi:hypothetical protein
MLTVIWHLLLNDEVFVEEGFSKKSVVGRSVSIDSKGLSLDDVAGILSCAVKMVSDNG